VIQLSGRALPLHLTPGTDDDDNYNNNNNDDDDDDKSLLMSNGLILKEVPKYRM
jgi:hypothetical protein